MTVPLDEFGRLLKILARDPSSQTCAALNDWSWPASREASVLMDLYDATARVNFKNPKPWPRPWDRPTQLGKTARDRQQVIALLKRAREGKKSEAVDG